VMHGMWASLKRLSEYGCMMRLHLGEYQYLL